MPGVRAGLRPALEEGGTSEGSPTDDLLIWPDKKRTLAFSSNVGICTPGVTAPTPGTVAPPASSVVKDDPKAVPYEAAELSEMHEIDPLPAPV